MSDHVAIAIAKIEGSKVTDDGNHALFELSTVSDERVTIAVPTDQLPELMSLTSQAMGNAQKIFQADPNMKYIFLTKWWEIGHGQEAEHVILSFQLDGGSELSFQVNKADAQNMRDALDVVLGRASSPVSSDTTKH